MSDESKTPDQASAENGKGEGSKTVSKRQEKRYDHDELVANARSLTGHPAHLVAGAIANDDRKTLTRKQATKAVEEFLGREVEVEKNEEDGE